jgi:hypothetical protein
MVAKEGDNLGIEAIRERIELDNKVMRELLGLEGVPKLYLRNAVPTKIAAEYVDDYEITPAYEYKWDDNAKQVKITEKPWITKDDEGRESYSLLAPPVAVAFIKQTAKALNL